MRRLAAFSVDLDEIGEYFAIHGLPASTDESGRAVYLKALPRLLEFAVAVDLPLTLFVIGRDLRSAGAREAMLPFVQRGDELGNHTLDHAYDVSRWPRADLRRQIVEAGELIREVTGKEPVGFRAPGYTLSDELLAELQDLGYVYDSSVFSCPSYYALKALALGGQRVLGRRSASVLDTPRILTAPTQPYRIGDPYYRRGSGLRELPIALTRHLRLPFFGTSLALLARGPMGAKKVRYFARQLGDVPVVNLELHGIDFLDTDDGLDALAAHQPGLGIPWRRKLEAYAEAVAALRGRGYSWTTLHELAVEALP